METLLIADDNPGVRRMLTQCLGAAGRSVLAVEDGDAALEVALARLPDLIILDVCMPGRGGHAVCAALRADARTAHIPIVLLSGMGEPEAADIGSPGGPDDYVCKPFNINDLSARVRALLGRAS